MPETIITKNLIARIDSCISRASLASGVEHNGLAGLLREIFLEDLLAPVLPAGFHTGSGKVIDRNGVLSNQLDIIIYNKSRFPPLLFDEKTGVFPIDSVQYVIEVKTRINATEIKDAIKKARSLRSLDGPFSHFVLFGFSSDVKSAESEFSRISKLQKESSFPPVNILCSVGNGYCYYEPAGNWYKAGEIEKRAEIIGLLIGIVNTLVTSSVPSTFHPGRYWAWWS